MRLFQLGPDIEVLVVHNILARVARRGLGFLLLSMSLNSSVIWPIARLLIQPAVDLQCLSGSTTYITARCDGLHVSPIAGWGLQLAPSTEHYCHYAREKFARSVPFESLYSHTEL